ncbi:NCS2 family permease [Gordonia sp. X0973]|uniref:NCS2 family permease n=1 Tax=Gordonia sp. X0973 TaxID=2742602 RepID=UPI0026573D59|nr:NCS2 family permease [Gordonia sp. X0973]
MRGGIVTFFTMAYIVVLNPIILGGHPGKPINADIHGDVLPMAAVAAVTALVAGVMCVVFGVVANYPFAFAAGLGVNSLLAVSVTTQVTWPEAMGLVVLNGVIIVALAVTGFRTAVFNAVPAELKAAITAGIGVFIAFIGFVNAGFVQRVPDAAHTTVPVRLGESGSISTWPVFVFAVGLLLMGVLTVRKVPGGLLIGIVLTTVLAIVVQAVRPSRWALNAPELPHSVGGLPDLSLIGKVDLFGAFTEHGSASHVIAAPAIGASILLFSIVLANFFDAMGTMTGLGEEAGLADENGTLPGIGKALVVEGTGAIAGGLGSASSNTVFVESASGIAEGARTGFANLVTGALFLAAMFFTPLYQVVPLEAVAPALVIVGALMIGQIRTIDLTRFEYALPAFLTIVAMPFTYSIANGIGLGFISWVVLATARGKAREVHPILWAVAVVFVVYFARAPIQELLT